VKAERKGQLGLSPRRKKLTQRITKIGPAYEITAHSTGKKSGKEYGDAVDFISHFCDSPLKELWEKICLDAMLSNAKHTNLLYNYTNLIRKLFFERIYNYCLTIRAVQSGN